MLPGETILSRGGDRNPRISEFRVMSSPAGYYIGTLFTHGPGPCDCGDDCPTSEGQTWEEPNSRETDYFKTRAAAEAALETYKTTGKLPKERF